MVFLFLKSDAGLLEVSRGGVDDAGHEEIKISQADTGTEGLTAALAVDDDHLGTRELLSALLEISQRDMDGLADMRGSVFRIGPDIEEDRVLIALEEGLDLIELEIGDFGLIEE